MTDAAARPRDELRSRLVGVAAQLLAAGGPGAVTTRSVAMAAGVQAPVIYRLFGDKAGLLQAVVAQGWADHVAGKRVEEDGDPVEALRAAWEVHIGFGLDHPDLFRLMHLAAGTSAFRDAVEAGERVLAARVHRVAEAGRLATGERRAVDLIAAAGTGAVLTLLDRPEEARDPQLAAAAWEAVATAILAEPARAVGDAVVAAVSLRAALPRLVEFSPAERSLLSEWLDRLAAAPEHDARQPRPVTR